MRYALLGRITWWVGRRMLKRKLGPLGSRRALAAVVVATAIGVVLIEQRRSSAS